MQSLPATPPDEPPVSSAQIPRHVRQLDVEAGRSGLSLRLRLMLMLLAVFGAIQVTISIIHLLYVRRTTNAVFNERLTAAVDHVSQELSSSAVELSDVFLVSVAHQGSPTWGQLAVSVYDESGNVVASSIRPPIPLEPVGGLERAMACPDEAIAAVATTTFVAGGPAEESRVAAAGIRDVNGRRLAIVVAASDAFVRTLPDRVSMHVVLLTPVGLIAAMAAGWLIAGVAVRPFRALSRIARQLGPDNLAEPIEIDSNAAELSKLQVELERMRQRLEAGYEAQERFVANVSHEIKTPIATVLTEAQTLKLTDAGADDVKRFVRSTEEEMRRLGKLVESFLTLTRIRHGKPLQGSTRVVPVNELVLDSVEHCARSARELSVTLVPHLAVEENEDLVVRGDPELLRTLLDNLLRNAIRFSPRGGSVVVTVAERADKTIEVAIRDSGAGIPEHLLGSVFERYAIAKRETGPPRGTGLGLEIAQGIAELHSGQITVRNVSEGGCEFTLRLPLASASATASAAAPDSTPVDAS